MPKTVKLTETELKKMIKKIISEQSSPYSEGEDEVNKDHFNVKSDVFTAVHIYYFKVNTPRGIVYCTAESTKKFPIDYWDYKISCIHTKEFETQNLTEKEIKYIEHTVELLFKSQYSDLRRQGNLTIDPNKL